jgi:glutamate-1-semialdehyde 2,1-aminomutase
MQGSPPTEGLRARARRLIPGGCHTYAKGDDQFPAAAPGFIARGAGAHVWDVEGREYIEYGMGLRAVTLGHAVPCIVEAVSAQLLLGTNFTRPSPLEAECAETLLGIVERGDQVKFAKDGSTVMTAAVKLARAVTGRPMIAVCADHPFFSSDDWFIGTTVMSRGIPEVVRALTLTYRYNDLPSLAALFDDHPGAVAAVVLEAARTEEPAPGFLEGLQALCRRHGALLVLDEMITGFRWHLRGAQHVYDVRPDLSAFGKAMSNGFAVSALVGRREHMRLGGIDHDEERVFLLSTTHGAELHALAAMRATLEIYQREPVVETLYRQGARLRHGLETAARELGVEGYFGVAGRDCNLVFVTRDATGTPSQTFRTLFMQELCRRGILAPSFVVSYAHGDAEIDATIEASRDALRVYRRALDDGPERLLVGPPVKPVFRRVP